MDAKNIQPWIEDFSQFCKMVDVKVVIAAADDQGNANGYDKELYAIAIVRAVKHGSLGSDWYQAQAAVSRLWERGCLSGFNTDSFNTVLKELGQSKERARRMVIPQTEDLVDKAVGV
jgi:hypothetical protein